MDKLKETVKEWVRLDEETSALRRQIKVLTKTKKDLSEHLLVIMKEKLIDEFDLSNEGKLQRQTKKLKQPINKKQLQDCLLKYYTAEPETAQKLTEYILDSRKERTVDVLCKK